MNPHAITIEKDPRRLQVKFNERIIADTNNALILREGKLPPVQYIPRQDVDTSLLERTTHTTHCPFKGDAAYYTIKVDGMTAEDAVWTYENPISAVKPIKDHLAFYEGKVKLIIQESDENP